MSLEIIIWDVNHGSSVSIKLPNGKILMLDCGSNPITDFSPIKRTRDKWNVDRLDALFISHPHMDHIRDLPNIDLINPKKILRPVVNHNELLTDNNGDPITGTPREILDKYVQMDNRYSEPSPPTEQCTHSNWSGNVKIQKFGLNGIQADLNDKSLVTFFSYGNFCFAYPGDLTSEGWEQLISQEGGTFTNMLSKVNFFVASHHGREEGFNPIIFNEMNPYLVFVSDKRTQTTSITGIYGEYCRGWNVYDQNNEEWMNDRKVLTTRSDGRIKVSVDIVEGKTQVGVHTILPEGL